MKKVLYIGWIGFKNLGDELMFDLFREHFETLGEKYQLESANIEDRYLRNVLIQDFDLIVLGGGSILSGSGYPIHPYIINYLYRCHLLNKKVMIWGSGIDWAPKSFITLLDENKEVPLSLTEDEKEKLNIVFRESVFSGVRGPLSEKLLKQAGVSHCHVSGDPGFLLSPKQLSLPKNNADKEKVIGVNWGTSFNNIYGQDEEKVEQDLAKALNEFIQQGYRIHLYSVWTSDFPAMKRLYSKLQSPEKVKLDLKMYSHDELMELMKEFTFTINFKLHPNYLSLAANTPFIALGYRFKVFDFARSIDFEEFLIPTDSQKIYEELLTLEQNVVQNSKQIKEKMSTYLQMYHEKIKEPFDHGLYI